MKNILLLIYIFVLLFVFISCGIRNKNKYPEYSLKDCEIELKLQLEYIVKQRNVINKLRKQNDSLKISNRNIKLNQKIAKITN